jgi:hypothetical protein
MSNPLTGDFEAVLQVSGSTVNRLLASMHQNSGSKPDLPSFPHGVWIRVGDPTAIDGMRGNILGQISVPRIELIHGVSDRFWLEVSVRARYMPDPGTVHIPEFIHGTVRAQYRIDKIDPSCLGWQKIASDYIWVRAIGDTVSFTGTAEEDASLLSVAAATVSAAEADARITRLARFLLTKRFEATPHKVSRRFRSGSMRSLNAGLNKSSVAVPIGLSGDPTSGNIASINQDILEGRHVGIAISRDVIIGKIQRELDAIQQAFLMSMRFYHKTHVDLGILGGLDVLTVTIDYKIKLATATAQWIGGSVPFSGVTLPGGLVAIHLTAQARTGKSLFNFDINITQMLLITFDAATEEFTAAPMGSAAVNFTGPFAGIIDGEARPKVQAQVATIMQNAAAGMAGELSLANRKSELVTQLKTMDDGANAWFDSAEFTADGVVVRGTIALTGRRKPVHSFKATAENDGYSGYESWIPGGRVDSFSWSWKWFNNAGKPGSTTTDDRFVLKRPPAKGQGKFGVMLGLETPLPGLDGMGQVCLVVRGVSVDPVTGEFVPTSTTKRCKQFGFDIRLAVPGRVFLTEWVPGPRDPIGPVAETAIHEVGGSRAAGHGANTLVVRVGERWNREIASSLREGLAASTRRDAGLVVLVLFTDGVLTRSGSEWLSEFRELTTELEAPLVVNEDVRGSWSRALSMDTREGEADNLEWRLISPTGGVTWAHTGTLDPGALGLALDDYLFRSPVAANGHSTYDLPLGTRVSSFAFESDVVGRFSDVEDTCPAPPFGRLGIEAGVTFVSKGSMASEAALRKLSAEGEGSESVRAVVFDGASADDLDEIRASLPPGVMAIPDPEGTIARRFGVRTWPSSISINEGGLVSAFNSGIDDAGDDSEEAEAS